MYFSYGIIVYKAKLWCKYLLVFNFNIKMFTKFQFKISLTLCKNITIKIKI